MLTYNSKTGEWEGTTGGVNLQKLAKKPQGTLAKKIKSQAELDAEIEAHPRYGFATRLIAHIFEQMELNCGKTVFRNAQVSCYRPNSKQIQFSYENINQSWDTCFFEYVTVAPIWRQQGFKIVRKNNGYEIPELTGKKAIWAIAIHEAAHAYQHTIQGSFANDHHGQTFQNCLSELITLFPYNEVENL